MTRAREAILARLIPLVAESVGVGVDHAVNAEMRFQDLALDSVVTLELLLGAEKAFGVALDGRELLEANAFETVGSLADFIAAKGGTCP